MTDQKITQIRIRGNLVGIVGLEAVMQTIAADFATQSDAAVGKEMVGRLSAKNYIPGNARDHYAAAFVREFRKFLSQPFEEEKQTDLEVLILGPGCFQCSRLEEDVRNVMAEINAPGELIHVTDLREIGKYGVMGMPALVINKKVVAVGSVPEKRKICQWLKEAMPPSGGNE